MTESMLDGEVVLGDHRLGRERDHLLAQVDQRLHAVDVGHQQREPGVERAVVAPSRSTMPARAWGTIRIPCASVMSTTAATTMSTISVANSKPSYSDTSAVAPSIFITSTRVPASMTSSSS